MHIFERRRRRLSELLSVMTAVDLHKRSGVAASSISAFHKRLPDGRYLRNIGEVTARKIELGTGKPEGWMDTIAAPEFTEENNISKSSINFVPLLSWVRAGEFCDAPQPLTRQDADEWLPAPLEDMGKGVFALEVRGDSMDAPTGYREGEFVYIDPDMAATHGKDVLARLDTGLTLKRYKEDEDGAYLFQLNGNKIIRPDAEWHVCGVVVFSGQRR